MNPEVKDKWLEALRSDKYKQGRGRLRTDNCYCCLGVLCDLYIEETEAAEWKRTPTLVEEYRFVSPKTEYEDGTAFLPYEVKVWAGLSQRNPQINAGKDFVYPGATTPQVGITKLNDIGHTFNEIADLIEEQL